MYVSKMLIWRDTMNWLALIVAIILSSGLSKILYTTQKIAESNGKPRCNWIHIMFWVTWSISFLLYLCILGLLIWVGIENYMNGDTFSSVKMFAVGLLLAPCVYLLFIQPVIKKSKK